jgi:RNA polymerase sigma factor (sigma-70 family)
MASNPAVLLRHLRRLASQHATDAASDPALLESFVRGRDERAFAALVARHGPMVLRVCRRVLADPHAAEDAFQATFLVLARRAGAIRRRQRLAGWLHGVAYRVARKARTAEALRQGREAPSADLAPPDPRPDPLAELTARELLGVLDEEVQRLPEVYRLPVLLCCLEGHTQEEAARRLGWTAGSVRGRLERGRARLRDRLARRGLTLPAALAVVGLGQGAASAGLSAALAGATVRAALAFAAAGGVPAGAISARVAALAEGGLKSMTAVKLKIGAALVLLTGVLVGGAGLAAYQARTATTPADRGEVVSRIGAREADQPKPEADKPPRTDWQGDPLPEGVLARMGSGRLRDRGAHLKFSSDGKTLISVGADGFRLWDEATGKLTRRTSIKKTDWRRVWNLSTETIILVSIDPDTGTLTCQVFDPATGQAREPIEFKTPDSSEPRAVSAGGKRIAVFHSDPQPKGVLVLPREGALLVYDAVTGKETFRVPISLPGAGQTANVDFAPDAKTIAVCDGRDTVRIYDATSGKLVWELKREGDEVRNVAFAPDGRSLVSMAYGPRKGGPRKPEAGEMSVWDLATGKERHRLKAEPGPVWTVAFSSDSRFMATGGHAQHHVLLWDLATGKEVRRLFTPPGTFRLAFSPDGKVLATCSSAALSLWDVATGQRLPVSAEPASFAGRIRFSPDGRRLIAFTGASMAWDAATGREVRRFADVPYFGNLFPVLSPDESLIAVTDLDWTIRLHDTATGKQVRALKGHEDHVWWMSIQFSRDGRRLVSSSRDKTIRVWDVTSGRELLKIPIGGSMQWPLAISPDDRWLACFAQTDDTAGNRKILIWDLATGREAQRPVTRLGYNGSLAFSPDSRLVAATTGHSSEGEDTLRLQVWEVATGKEFAGFVNAKGKGLGPAVFSPDGRMLATGGWDGTILLWELATRRQRWQFKGHEDSLPRLDGVAFSPDGRALAAASGDAPVYLWDVLGRLEQRLPHTPAELEQAWADLRSDDATAAFRIMRRLINAPEQAVPFLRKQVPPAAPVEAKRLARLIADLDSERFEVRQQATTELAELGEQAEPALRQALAGQPTLEARQRLEQLVEKLAGPVTSPDRLRTLRALEVLEHIGTSEARQVLEGLTKGMPEARLTREAKASLERLARRPTAAP